MRRLKIFTTLFLLAATAAFHWPIPFFQIPREHNLFVCLFAFWLGMLFIEYREKLSKLWVTAVFGGIALFFIFVKMPLDPFICAQFIAVGLFLIFYHVGTAIMKQKKAAPFFRYTSKISYAIFLLQHVTMGQILGLCGAYPLSVGQEAAVLLVVILFIYLFADISTRLNRMFTSSRAFLKLQEFVTGKKA